MVASVRSTHPEVAYMPEIRDPKTATEDLTKLDKDALYVSVGLAVLAVQKVQVRRAELRKQMTDQVTDARSQFSKLLDDRVKLVEERLEGVESRFDALLDQLEDRLPEQARSVAQQARTAAKEARTQARTM